MWNEYTSDSLINNKKYYIIMTIGELTDKIQNVIDDSELGLVVTHSEMGGKNDDSFYETTVSGGKNGDGKWGEYFSDLSKFVNAVESNGMEIWLVKMYNDVLDDVFYATFGIRFDEGI